MITVGSVYMSIPDAPIQEIMKDMMEMSRGVLHPIRGLFLRHYLSQQTRDHLPIGITDGCVYEWLCSNVGLTSFFQTNRQAARFYLLCPYQLHRNEQTLGTASTSRPFEGPGET